MIESFTREPVALWFSRRLHDARDELAQRWRAVAFDRAPNLADLIASIADYLEFPDMHLAADQVVMEKAAAIGALHFARGGSLHDIMRDYQRFGELLEAFLVDEVHRTGVRFALDEVVRALRGLRRSILVLQQQSVEAYSERSTATIARQGDQLIAFGRLVGHELRKPLSVLRLLAGVVPIREGDHELTRVLDVFDRNIRRLTDVVARLERLSHDGLDGVVTTRETVDLGELVADVVEKLRDMATTAGVDLRIDADLPRLRVDAARTEMMFVSLIANAIKYSDGAKPQRLVEVLNGQGRARPTVIVRDNGVGIERRRVQHFFREFSRAHGHREREHTNHGLGLGLSIVRDAMDASGGTVLLQSAEGVGTTVTLSWPERARPAAR